jgi:adenylate kinase family enzyme
MDEQQKNNSLIILSGPPGAGKTTVARELICYSAAPAVYIEGDTFWPHIVKSANPPEIRKNFRAVTLAMIAAAIAYAASGYEVILDFSIPPVFIEAIHKLIGSRDVAVDYIVLLPEESICATRAADRENGAVKDYAVFHEFYLSFDEAHDYIVSDVAGAPMMAIQLRKQLAKGKFRLHRNTV